MWAQAVCRRSPVASVPALQGSPVSGILRCTLALLNPGPNGHSPGQEMEREYYLPSDCCFPVLGGKKKGLHKPQGQQSETGALSQRERPEETTAAGLNLCVA